MTHGPIHHGPGDASEVYDEHCRDFPRRCNRGFRDVELRDFLGQPRLDGGHPGSGLIGDAHAGRNVAASTAPGTDVISVTATANGAETDDNQANNTAIANTSIQARAAGPIPTLQEWLLLLFGL